MFLVDGIGILEVGDEKIVMELFKPYHIPPKTIHRLSSPHGLFKENLYIASQGATVVEVSSSQLDDVVRLEDDYGRGNC